MRLVDLWGVFRRSRVEGSFGDGRSSADILELLGRRRSGPRKKRLSRMARDLRQLMGFPGRQSRHHGFNLWWGVDAAVVMCLPGSVCEGTRSVFGRSCGVW